MYARNGQSGVKMTASVVLCASDGQCCCAGYCHCNFADAGQCGCVQ
jgi:hypothetical protein